MIKAETTFNKTVSDSVLMQGVSVEATGTHHDLINEVRAILDSFIEKEAYRNDIFRIIDYIIENELEQLKKENK